MRNPKKPIPKTPAAKNKYAKLRSVEAESAERKKIVRAGKRAAARLAAGPGKPDDVRDEDFQAVEADEKDISVPVSESAGYYSKRSDFIASGVDEWGFAWFHDIHHPINKKKLPSECSDASPNCYFEVTDQIALLDTHVSWYTVTTYKGRRWSVDDYDITMWSDRGKGRAQLVKYRRRMASLNENTLNSVNIVRVVMGNHLIGFLINNFYGCGRCIPYPMLSVTKNGNGCLRKQPEDADVDPNWLSSRWVHAENFSEEIRQMRKTHKMVDLAELTYWGYWGFEYEEEEYCEMEEEDERKTQIRREYTDETDDVDVGSDREQDPGYVYFSNYRYML